MGRDAPHFFSRSGKTPAQKHSISAETDSISDIFLRMARFPRVVVEDVPHHAMQRGNARQVILAGDADRLTYKALLRENPPRTLLSTALHTKIPNSCDEQP